MSYHNITFIIAQRNFHDFRLKSLPTLVYDNCANLWAISLFSSQLPISLCIIVSIKHSIYDRDSLTHTNIWVGKSGWDKT